MSDLHKNELIEEILDLIELSIETLDMDDEEDIETLFCLIDCFENANNIPNKKRQTEWVKPWRLERAERSSFSFLMVELYCDTSSFFDYIRVIEDTFHYILGKIEKDIKKDTVMRKSISPAEKLAATLRYLATGESYKSTNFQTRLSSGYLCNAIPEMYEAI